MKLHFLIAVQLACAGFFRKWKVQTPSIQNAYLAYASLNSGNSPA